MKVTYTTPAGTAYKLYLDALKQHHILVAGVTGSGKSTVINALIYHALFCAPGKQAGGVEFILIDPKRIELAPYKDLPHTIAHARGQQPELWLSALNKALEIMDKRYEELERAGGRTYAGGDLYVIIDEWADLKGYKDCVLAVRRLIAEGRAAKVHVILATQSPKASILPTEIRDQFTCKFGLRTDNATQSRTIMAQSGCEDLPQYGKAYYCRNSERQIVNVPRIEDNELDARIAWWTEQKPKTLKEIFFPKKPTRPTSPVLV